MRMYQTKLTLPQQSSHDGTEIAFDTFGRHLDAFASLPTTYFVIKQGTRWITGADKSEAITSLDERRVRVENMSSYSTHRPTHHNQNAFLTSGPHIRRHLVLLPLEIVFKQGQRIFKSCYHETYVHLTHKNVSTEFLF
jgi:hypothetical protein